MLRSYHPVKFAKIWISLLKFKFSQIFLGDKNATYLCSKIISTFVLNKPILTYEAKPRVISYDDSNFLTILIFFELKLNWNWTEIDLKLNWNWTEIELKLKWNWNAIKTKLKWNWNQIKINASINPFTDSQTTMQSN